MSEEKEEVSIATEREEREGGGPTSIDVIDNQISIGNVSFAEPQGEKCTRPEQRNRTCT